MWCMHVCIGVHAAAVCMHLLLLLCMYCSRLFAAAAVCTASAPLRHEHEQPRRLTRLALHHCDSTRTDSSSTSHIGAGDVPDTTANDKHACRASRCASGAVSEKDTQDSVSAAAALLHTSTLQHSPDGRRWRTYGKASSSPTTSNNEDNQIHKLQPTCTCGTQYMDVRIDAHMCMAYLVVAAPPSFVLQSILLQSSLQKLGQPLLALAAAGVLLAALQ